MEVGGKRHVPVSVPPFHPERDPLPLVQRAGWVPGPVWTGVESLAPHRHAIPGPSSPQRVAVQTAVSRPVESFGSLLLLLPLRRTECCKPKLWRVCCHIVWLVETVYKMQLFNRTSGGRFGHGRQVLLYSFILPEQVNVVCWQGLYGWLQYCLFASCRRIHMYVTYCKNPTPDRVNPFNICTSCFPNISSLGVFYQVKEERPVWGWFPSVRL